MEFLLQAAWPELRVHVTTVTDQWAAIALAGPRSRDLLCAASTGAELGSKEFPSASVAYADIGGANVRIHRVSYSGELAYEIFVPSGHGLHVWATLARAGKPFDLIAYGTEAMGALRIEKGHVAGSELDGRTTLRDLGLQGLAAADKPFIGAVLRKRPLLDDPERPLARSGSRFKATPIILAGALLFCARHAGQGPWRRLGIIEHACAGAWPRDRTWLPEEWRRAAG